MYLKYATTVITCLLPFVTANCYVGNGTDRNDGQTPSDRYSACDTDSSGASMCCSQSYGGDSCQPLDPSNPAAALCWNQGSNVLWRESCTDKSWSSVNCVKLFMNVSDTDIPITNCSASGLGPGFCYGNLNLDCCRAGEAVFIDPATGEQVATNPDTPSSTASSSPSSTPTASPSSSATSQSSSGLSTGAKAGIGVGVSLGVIALLVVGMVLYGRRRGYVGRSSKTSSTPMTSTESEYYKPPIHSRSVEAGSGPVSELKGHSGRDTAAELPAYSVRTSPGMVEGGPVELGH